MASGFGAALRERLVVGPAIRDLGHENPRIRKVAATLLFEQRSRRAVPALLRALKDPEQEVKREAARALGAIGDPAAIAALVALLADDKEKLRQCAEASLQQIDADWVNSAEAREAGPALLSRVREGCRWIGVLRLLGDLACSEAAPDLIELLDTTFATDRPDGHLLRAIVEALGAIGEDLDAQVRSEAIRALSAVLSTPDRRLKRNVVHALDRLDPKWPRHPATRSSIRALVWALTRRRFDAEFQSLLERIDPDWKQCPEARELVPKLLERDLHPRLAIVLGQIGDRRALPPLIVALAHADQDTREAAAAAVQEIDPGWAHSPEALAAVPELIQAVSTHAARAFAAIEALDAIGDPRALESLIQALVHFSLDVREKATEALEKLAPEGIERDQMAREFDRLTERLEAPKERERKLAARSLRLIRGGPERG